jgi:hypothetical protein
MLRKAVGIAGTMVMLAAAAVVVPQRGTADSTKDVLVVNAPSQPVPVTGNVSLGGTANVNVTNTPNVNIVSLPAVQLAAGTNVGISGTPNVNVANQPTVTLAPGVVVGVRDEGARNPFQRITDILLPDGAIGNGVDLFTVPAGKRFVLDDISGIARLPIGEKLASAYIQFKDSLVEIQAPIAFSGTGPLSEDIYEFGRQARAYGNPGETVAADVARSDASGPASAVFTITGHLVDLQ